MQAWASLCNHVRSSASGPPGSGGIELHNPSYRILADIDDQSTHPRAARKTGNFRARLGKVVQNPSASPLTVETFPSRPYNSSVTALGQCPLAAAPAKAPIPLPNKSGSHRLTHHGVRAAGALRQSCEVLAISPSPPVQRTCGRTRDGQTGSRPYVI